MLEAYKILSGAENVDSNIFFTRAGTEEGGGRGEGIAASYTRKAEGRAKIFFAARRMEQTARTSSQC